MKYKIKFYNILRDRQILIMFWYSQNENTVSLKKTTNSSFKFNFD